MERNKNKIIINCNINFRHAKKSNINLKYKDNTENYKENKENIGKNNELNLKKNICFLNIYINPFITGIEWIKYNNFSCK